MGLVWFQSRSAVETLHCASPARVVQLQLPELLKHRDAFCTWRDKYQTVACELEKHKLKMRSKGIIAGHYRKEPLENQFILLVLGHRKQCKARPMTPSPVCCLHVVTVCHLHDAYVSLQDFFIRIFFGRDKLWSHSHTLALVVDQHVLLVRGVPWVTCRQRRCSPGPRRGTLKPALATR